MTTISCAKNTTDHHCFCVTFSHTRAEPSAYMASGCRNAIVNTNKKLCGSGEISHWSLISSALLKHCIAQGADDIWESTMRVETIYQMCSDRDRDEKRLDIKTSAIKGAGRGLFAKKTLVKDEPIGMSFGGYSNDAMSGSLPSDISATNLRKMIDEYESECTDKCNVEEVLSQTRDKQWTLHFKVTKSVAPGEELLRPYGFHVWLLDFLGDMIQVNGKLSKNELSVLEKCLIDYVGTDKLRAYAVFAHVARQRLQAGVRMRE